MTALYNELEPYAAAWLGNLIAAGHIAPGRVDARSIRDLRAADLVGRRQVHLFAGLGAWSRACRLAGIPDDYPLWTCSCPCQPFSDNGERGGFDDERHLWPDAFRLVRECGPDLLVGEQVASPLGYAWLDLVCADLEGAGYAVGAIVAPAAGVGAPHRRHRIYFGASRVGVGQADADPGGRPIERLRGLLDGVGPAPGDDAHGRGAVRGLADPHLVDGDGGRPRSGAHRGEQRVTSDVRGGEYGLLSRGLADRLRPRLEGHAGDGDHGHEPGRLDALAAGSASAGGGAGGLAHADRIERQRGAGGGRQAGDRAQLGGGPDFSAAWRDVAWVACRDGKLRPAQPGTFPLAHGAPARVGRLRAYGNAIVAPLAAAFLTALLATLAPETP